MGNYVLNELQGFLDRLDKAQSEMNKAQNGKDYYSFDACWDNVKDICNSKNETSVTHAITEARRFLATVAGGAKPKPYKSKWEKGCLFEVDQQKPAKRAKGQTPKKQEDAGTA